MTPGATMTPLADPFDIDADLRNADWLRSRTWDLRGPGGLVTTLDQLREHFGGDDERLAHFMDLPAAKPMPKELRAAAEAHLFGGATMKMRVVKADELERLAALEHEQWEAWTRSLAERGDVPAGLVEHWRTNWVPYGALPEAEKEKDREWARRALSIAKADGDGVIVALVARDRIDEEIQKYADDQPRDEQGRWTSGGGIFDPKAPAADRPHVRDLPENPGYRPALGRVMTKVAAANQGRRLQDAQGKYTIPAPGEDGKPWSEAKLAKEIAKAEEVTRTRPSTLETWGTLSQAQKDARVEDRKAWVRAEYGQGAKPPPGQPPRADIWMGPSGAGKSTMEQRFLDSGHKAVRIDADRFKERMPENDNGLGANQVHEESSNLANRLMDRARTHGDNISVAIVGKTYSNADPHDPGVLERVQSLKAQGYDVHLHLINAKPETSLENTTRRFVEQGRYISGTYVYNGVDSKPVTSFKQLATTNKDLFSSVEAINNENRGSPVTYHPELGDEIP